MPGDFVDKLKEMMGTKARYNFGPDNSPTDTPTGPAYRTDLPWNKVREAFDPEAIYKRQDDYAHDQKMALFNSLPVLEPKGEMTPDYRRFLHQNQQYLTDEESMQDVDTLVNKYSLADLIQLIESRKRMYGEKKQPSRFAPITGVAGVK